MKMASKKKVVPRRKPSEGAKGKKKPFRVKVGARYFTRDGRIVGPVIETQLTHAYRDTHPFFVPGIGTVTKAGIYHPNGVSEFPDDLVREVVKRRGK
jgi:hypothetical protein